MGLNRKIQAGDNDDITQERLKATFDTDLLGAEIKGGMQNLLRIRELAKEVDKRPELQDWKPVGHMSRVEKVDNASRKSRELFQQLSDFSDPMNPFEIIHLIRDVFGVDGYPLALHSLMFVPTLQNQTDAEQQEWWLWKALQGEILGTYAQTEMGHGTNLSKIETLATYDRSTEQFVLHSPTVTSLKWWPGGLGNTANHVVLVANLIIDEKNHGPHIFMVQIRDMKTHKPMPGVRVGDIGAKMGILGVDNGFLGFDHYRIPRRNMLMKHAKVEADGTYINPAHAKIGYTTMMYVRAEIVMHQAIFLMYTMTIAIRYAAIRRQGEIVPGAGEVRILDYQTQQHRLFPHLARTFAFHFAGDEVRHLTGTVMEEIKKGKVDALADLHAISCCLKSVVTFQACQGIEQGRMACGGHGYSDASFFPTLYSSAAGACTYEGENIVMLLQTSRYLMRAAKMAREEGKSLGPLMGYLLKKPEKHSLIDRVPQGDYSHYLLDYEHIARSRIFFAFDRLEKLKQKGMADELAWNANTVDMNKASRAHARLFLAKTFFSRLSTVVDNGVRDVMTDLLRLYLNHELIDQDRDLLQDGYMTGEQVRFLKEDLYRLYEKVRPNAVSIVDSFDLHDRELRSVLGRRDGHVYDNLYKWAQQSQLNEHPNGVSPTFEKYLKPLMLGEKSKM